MAVVSGPRFVDHVRRQQVAQTAVQSFLQLAILWLAQHMVLTFNEIQQRAIHLRAHARLNQLRARYWRQVLVLLRNDKVAQQKQLEVVQACIKCNRVLYLQLMILL